MPTAIPTLTPYSVAAPTRDDPDNFSSRGDTIMTEMVAMVPATNTMIAAMNLATAEVYASDVASAAAAEAAEASAAAAALSTGVAKWLAATAYSEGQSAWSPIDYYTYRRKTAGTSATDPSADPTNWTLTTKMPGVGGTGSASSITLTVSSEGVQTITPTAYGQYIKLPTALNFFKSAAPFHLKNASEYPVKILNNSGTLLGFIPAFSSVIVGISDNTTAAGVWSLQGAEPIAVTAELVNSSLTSVTNAFCSRIVIDADRTLLLSGAVTSGNLYGVVYNASTNTFGSVTLIRSGAGAHKAILSATDQVLVITCPTGSTTLQAVVLSLSDTTITVNTAASKAIATFSNSGFGSLIAVGSTWVVSYGVTSPTNNILAFTISGTTVTIGNTSVPTTNTTEVSPTLYYVSSTTFLAIAHTSAGPVYAKMWTVSAGVTLTGGSETSVSTDTGGYRSIAVGARIAVFYSASSVIRCMLISISGTTPTNTTVAIGSVASTSTLELQIDCAVNGTMLYAAFASGAGIHFYTLDATTATISASSALAYSNTGGNYVNNQSGNAAIGTLALLLTNGTTLTFGAVFTNGYKQYAVDYSGANPVLVNHLGSQYGAGTGQTIGPFGSSIRNCVRDGRILVSSNRVFINPIFSVSQHYNAFSGTTKATKSYIPVSVYGDVALAGAANEMWAIGTLNNNTGLVFQRLECVQ